MGRVGGRRGRDVLLHAEEGLNAQPAARGLLQFDKDDLCIPLPLRVHKGLRHGSPSAMISTAVTITRLNRAATLREHADRLMGAFRAPGTLFLPIIDGKILISTAPAPHGIILTGTQPAAFSMRSATFTSLPDLFG
jgi:hypothetical protein